MENCRLLLFDLDGTLLCSDKTISKRTLKALQECRKKGILTGVSTSRGEQNVLSFLDELKPDILITSGGALVKYNGRCIYKAMFSKEETRNVIQAARDICGAGCIRFSDGYWYKFTKKTATKEKAVLEVCAACEITPEEITAFGDDYADTGMLELCGKGIAMGNAADEVKEKADLVIGSNDEDGIAVYLEEQVL